MSNHLADQTSPYLLQHAQNPVDWYPWGEEALQLALSQDKPILVSIGYAACHWCHVMEKESFEDQATADYMNAHFINIKVDREERPDIDHLYMDAVQAITGQGGWPLNVFLTPDTRPFFGGTYFPPVRFGQRPSWKEVLTSIATSYSENKDDIEAQAHNLLQHLQNAAQVGGGKQENIFQLSKATIADKIREQYQKQTDYKWGGFGRAPKFPASLSLKYLLRDYSFSGSRDSSDIAIYSLNKMIHGGIYDQIGGGFSRYSTDEKWMAPHFEKMLYDNALLLDFITEAFQWTRTPEFEDKMREIVPFLCREMQHPEGAFYAALDADSEGEEGKYYTWQKTEIEQILGLEAELFCLVYDVETKGNWENSNILWMPQDLNEIAEPLKINPAQLEAVLKGCRAKLLAAREKRIHPGLDDKIILGWNALMISALVKMHNTLGEGEYLALAENCYSFLKTHLYNGDGQWRHTWKDGKAPIMGFLDDYAYIIRAARHLQEATSKEIYFTDALATMNYVLDHFSTPEQQFFYFTDSDQKILVRKIDLYDNATPSGNAVMADNLLMLSILFDKPVWRTRAYAMVDAIGKTICNYPASFGAWCAVWQKMVNGIHEIAVIGEDAPALAAEVLSFYQPNRLLQFSEKVNQAYPLLADKKIPAGKTFIYLCKDYACSQPVETVKDLQTQLRFKLFDEFSKNDPSAQN
ncbi:MAG TPA: thioredoxin domain-containing protein [Arachidicoccus sp.]|nr:thioredoxin domain-containing protein [Arachidicoccus sp.]